MELSSQKLIGTMFSKDIHLSDLSLPDLFPDGAGPSRGKDKTPQSKKTEQSATPSGTARRIILDSSPGSEEPDPRAGKRNRSLEEVMADLEPEPKDVPLEVEVVEQEGRVEPEMNPV